MSEENKQNETAESETSDAPLADDSLDQASGGNVLWGDYQYLDLASSTSTEGDGKKVGGDSDFELSRD